VGVVKMGVGKAVSLLWDDDDDDDDDDNNYSSVS
jgi:hypothetical protein